MDPVGERLRAVVGERLSLGEPLARHTSARVGGPAEYLVEANSAGELAEAAGLAWELGLPLVLLGGGSNVLVSDRGVRGLVVLNKARQVRFEEDGRRVWAESGTNFGSLARQAAGRGLSGLEWAAGIPGTLGGAVFGNAGAHGQDLAGSLALAEILHPDLQREMWPAEKFDFGYRTSRLKKQASAPQADPAAAARRPIVLSTVLKLEPGDPEAIQARLEEWTAFRRRTQPPGASMGSMFKNPPGDHAGRLIEAAGLKGTRVGRAEISPLHANFFVNLGQASAGEIASLLELAQSKVAGLFGVRLEPEIELIGEWK